MKIKNLENLDVGMSNIEIEGNVTYANDPKNWTGESKGRKYNFWSQFVAVEDDTDSIGCSITIKKEEDALEEGDHVKIRGKLEEYEDKEGNMQKKLRGRVVRNKEDKKEATGEGKNKEEKKEATGEKKANNTQENKNLHIARECAIKASVELIVAKKIKYEELFSCAEEIVKYIYEGYQKPEKEELVKKSIKPEKDTKDEIADEDIPF